jgi:hypothetical protein
MRVERSYLAVLAAVVAILVFFAYAVAVSQGVSRTVTITELRAGGANFVLSGVQVRETGYTDPQFPDAPSQAYFVVTFPDRYVENVTVFIGGYCYAGGTSTVPTFHRNPMVFFTYACGAEYIRVIVR